MGQIQLPKRGNQADQVLIGVRTVHQGQIEARSLPGRSLSRGSLAHLSSGRQAKLLSLRHVPDQAFPLEIVPESFNYPDYLIKKRIVPARKKTLLGPSILDSLGELIPEHTVTNKWVCETPREFRRMLAEALNLGSVKSLIVNLVAGRAIREIPLSGDLSGNEPIVELDREDP